MEYDEMISLLGAYHKAACKMSYYNAAEADKYDEEKEAREEATEILANAGTALKAAEIPFPTGYLR